MFSVKASGYNKWKTWLIYSAWELRPQGFSLCFAQLLRPWQPCRSLQAKWHQLMGASVVWRTGWWDHEHLESWENSSCLPVLQAACFLQALSPAFRGCSLRSGKYGKSAWPGERGGGAVPGKACHQGRPKHHDAYSCLHVDPKPLLVFTHTKALWSSLYSSHFPEWYPFNAKHLVISLCIVLVVKMILNISLLYNFLWA